MWRWLKSLTGVGAEDGTTVTRGRLWIVSAPSGAGKTSLVKALCVQRPDLVMSVSYTTRAKRPRETDGVDYRFVDPTTFASMVADGKFLEHAEVFGNCYGTARADVEALLEAGRGVILEIDWQGARQARAAMPEAGSIFVLPPSRATLEQRLRGRGSDSEEVIRRRLGEAVADMGHWHEFDYVVVNDDFDTALGELAAIVAGDGTASRAGRPEVAALAKELVGEPA